MCVSSLRRRHRRVIGEHSEKVSAILTVRSFPAHDFCCFCLSSGPLILKSPHIRQRDRTGDCVKPQPMAQFSDKSGQDELGLKLLELPLQPPAHHAARYMQNERYVAPLSHDEVARRVSGLNASQVDLDLIFSDGCSFTLPALADLAVEAVGKDSKGLSSFLDAH